MSCLPFGAVLDWENRRFSFPSAGILFQQFIVLATPPLALLSPPLLLATLTCSVAAVHRDEEGVDVS